SGMLFELLAGLPGTRQRRLQPFGLLLDAIPQRGYPLLCFCCRTRRRFVRRHGVTRHLILQLSHQPARMLVQSAGGAILSFCERTLDRRTPPRLRCFQVNRKLPVGGLHGRECLGYLLLNLIGRGTQRLALRSRRFSRFLERPRVRRQTFAPIVRTTAAAPRKPPAKRLPARPPEFAAWRLPPAAQPDAPTVTTHPSCLPGKGTLLDCPPQTLAEARLRPNARRHPFRPPLAAVTVSPVPHLTSSPLAPTRGIPPNPPAEKRCPRRCRKLPAPAPLEKA